MIEEANKQAANAPDAEPKPAPSQSPAEGDRDALPDDAIPAQNATPGS